MIADIKKSKITVKALAEIYGVTITTVYAWEKLKLFKKGADGQIFFVDAVSGIYKHQKKLVMGKGGDDLLIQRVRAATADAERKEIELAQLRGELVSTEEIKREAFNIARETRDAIENIPSRISAILAAESNEHQVKETLKNELRQALAGLSR